MPDKNQETIRYSARKIIKRLIYHNKNRNNHNNRILDSVHRSTTNLAKRENIAEIKDTTPGTEPKNQ